MRVFAESHDVGARDGENEGFAELAPGFFYLRAVGAAVDVVGARLVGQEAGLEVFFCIGDFDHAMEWGWELLGEVVFWGTGGTYRRLSVGIFVDLARL